MELSLLFNSKQLILGLRELLVRKRVYPEIIIIILILIIIINDISSMINNDSCTQTLAYKRCTNCLMCFCFNGNTAFEPIKTNYSELKQM